MNREEWRKRYYTSLPLNVTLVALDHRDEHIQRVWAKVMDYHAFGQMLYHDVIAKQTGGAPFTGRPDWFARQIKLGNIPKPNKPFPVGQVNQAITLFNYHTKALFTTWAERCKTPTFEAYMAWLRRRAGSPISAKPITDPYTLEDMKRRRVTTAR